MRRLIAAFVAVLSLFSSTVLPARAAAPIDTIARSAYIVDMTTGTVLLDKNADMRIPTASMSKIMTTAVVFDAIHKGQLSLSDMLPVSEKAWRMGGSKMFVELGSKISVDDLLKGVIVQSGNDATIVLAEGLAGSENAFVDRMNAMAGEWGLKNTHFMDASGMPDPGHYSTARDLATISEHLIRDYPEDYKYYGMREFTWHKITQPNRNPLLGKVEGADGIKTGHTEEAGYCLIGSAERNGRRVVMVVTGLPSWDDRVQESTRLMEWALRNFKVETLLKRGQVVGQAPVVYGAAKSVPLIVGADAVATVPATYNPRDRQVKIRFMTPLVAPVKAGQTVGTVLVDVAGAGTQEFPLLAGSAVDTKGWFALTFDKIIQAAKNK
ncbi:MAG: D-alanyl-D-alanine carboxypeptidase [Rhodospirillales bacterium]|nr:D-alanyl-D-alanine carboxypeptidase [Alphaproteobacteria bacterium]MCB9987612.1 D-alanyl-D-alanine carboxypeptidase [Rhodospirillales bacterium]USO07673.1 MAG: D-alanyl-D-alanine carboxypeptidase [Rhodospirillales bacterium]